MREDELCLKTTFVKESFMMVTIFLDVYENLGEKALLTLPASSILK